MNEQDLDQIEGYLTGTLTEAEKRLVEQRLGEDAAFSEAFYTRKKMERYLAYKAGPGIKMEQIDRLNARFFQQTRLEKRPAIIAFFRKHWLPAAAAALVLIIAGLFLFRPGERSFLTDEQLYNKYARHLPLDLTSRGAEGCAESAELQTLYNNGQYQQALPLIETCLAAAPNDLLLRLASGIAELEAGDLEEAEQVFGELAGGNTLLRPDGLWYLALTQLKKGDRAGAIRYLQDIPEAGSRYSQARLLLQELGVQ